jgi:hypothetical protein
VSSLRLQHLYRFFTLNPCACADATGILDVHPFHGRRPGGNMKDSDKDPDDTFSDLLKVIALVVIVMVVLAIWYFSA